MTFCTLSMKGLPVRLSRSSLGLLLALSADIEGSVGEPNRLVACEELTGDESANGLLDAAATGEAFCCCDALASFSFCSCKQISQLHNMRGSVRCLLNMSRINQVSTSLHSELMFPR